MLTRAGKPFNVGLTPQKKCQRYYDEAEVDEGEEDANMTNIWRMPEGLEGEEVVWFLQQAWNPAVESISTLADAVENLDSCSRALADRVGKDIDVLEDECRKIGMAVGQDPGIADVPLPSVWAALDFLKRRNNAIASKPDDLSGQWGDMTTIIDARIDQSQDLHVARLESKVYDLIDGTVAKEVKKFSDDVASRLSHTEGFLGIVNAELEMAAGQFQDLQALKTYVTGPSNIPGQAMQE